jgi:hypothetical protein
MINEVRGEIISFHNFLQDWIAGRVQESESLFRSEIADHFAESFEFVMPDGTHMQRGEIIGDLQGAYGTDPTFRIEIKIRSVRVVSSEVFLALYEESQIEEGQENRRLSLAVLAKHAHSHKGLTWLHCHESPLRC